MRVVHQLVQHEHREKEQSHGIDRVIEHDPEEEGEEIGDGRRRVPVSIPGGAEELDDHLEGTDHSGILELGGRVVMRAGGTGVDENLLAAAGKLR